MWPSDRVPGTIWLAAFRAAPSTRNSRTSAKPWVVGTCPSPCTLSPNAKVGDAIRLMTEGGYRHIPLVEEDGRSRGLVSARDVVRFIADHFPTEVYNLPPGFRQRIRTCEGG